MKNLITFAIIFVMTLTTTCHSFANGDTAHKKSRNSKSNTNSESSSFFKSYIKTENGSGKYAVKVVRQSMKPVLITVLDKHNNVVFTETIDVDYNFERVYDISSLESEAKSIVVYSGKNYVEHKIN